MHISFSQITVSVRDVGSMDIQIAANNYATYNLPLRFVFSDKLNVLNEAYIEVHHMRVQRNMPTAHAKELIMRNT